jgi:hypothetical protein
MAMDVAAQSRKLSIAGWVVTGLVGAFLAMSASFKFFTPDMALETMATLGWPDHHLLLIGIVEAACVVLYLVPRTAVLGAVLETALLGGAVATQVRVDNPLFSHELFGVYLGVLVWLGLWLRDPRLRALMPLVRR